jgi:hypothetical protein
MRYIDADELIKQMKDGKYDEIETYFQRGVNSAIDYWITEINHFPTADVVPKSEVEEAVEKLMSATDKVICEAKQEVAREIFEEIEEMCLDIFGNFHSVVFAELKKKYMGSVIVGEWKFDEKINTEQPDLSNVKFIDKDGNITNRDDALDWNEAPPLEESEDK